MSVLDRRRAGILLHPTSLPGPSGQGELGEDAMRFVDFLAAAGLSCWQTLPLGPTHADRSPYHALSVHAGNPSLISLGRLAEWGWLGAAGGGAVTQAERGASLYAAYHGFLEHSSSAERAAFEGFAVSEAHWLDDYALYQALRSEHDGQPWWQWPAALRDREPAALAAARARLGRALTQARFEQYVFFRQWRELRSYANDRGILLFGDMPIFVAHDSADVWARRGYFALDEAGQPLVVAGVPPDYFSEHGQRWGNPLYRWKTMQADGFRWWIDRLRTQLELFDLVRVDHFRGFEACWEIPAAEQTAVNGRWAKAPGDALFGALLNHFGALPLIAEDLGVITPEVQALRERYGLPGMRILQFAFDSGPDNPYLPHAYEPETVVYTGTHDNDTTLGWFEGLAEDARQHVLDYLGQPAEPMPWPLLRCSLASVAALVVLPMQDVMLLGSGYRMNTPGTTHNNWLWRFEWDAVPAGTAERLRHLVWLYGRD